MSPSIHRQSSIATKWSLLTEVVVKLISPITQLVLARLLSPSAFGVVATVVMVTSFAEMIADSGFQKYLIQHDFKNERELHKNANVAFFSTLTVALLLWFLITLFRNELASVLGAPDLGVPLVVASASLPLLSFSSIQLTLFKRKLDFKRIMPARIIVAMVPFFVTIPLALGGFGYWALIIGTLAGNAVNVVVLSVLSEWFPKLFFSFSILKKMFSFSWWTLLESISIWLSTWAGTFVVGTMFDSYYLGLYRQPMALVNAGFGIISNATTPVLFSSLSRLKSDAVAFKSFFFRYQYAVASFLLPLGVIIFLFRDVITFVLLGEQWLGATLMVGSYGLVMGFMVIFSYYCSEIYRSLGKPNISLLVQCIFLSIMVPALFASASLGFNAFVICFALLHLVLLSINQIATYLLTGISFLSMISNLKEPLLSVIGMTVFGGIFTAVVNPYSLLNFAGIAFCVLMYFALCLCFKKSRSMILELLKRK